MLPLEVSLELDREEWRFERVKGNVYRRRD